MRYSNLQVPFLSPKTLRLTVHLLNHVNRGTFKSALLAKDSKLLLQKYLYKIAFAKMLLHKCHCKIAQLQGGGNGQGTFWQFSIRVENFRFPPQFH